jgi:CHAT domain-containing protein/tetratricopeptide (TPR) repeat protein
MDNPLPEQMTRLLAAWSDGDKSALDQLMPVVHDELRRLAHRHMMRKPLCSVILVLSILFTGTFARPLSPMPRAQTIDDLSARLIEAKDTQERARLLDANKDLLNPQLRKRLTAKAVRAVITGDYDGGLNINSVIQLIGEHRNDKAWFAVAMINSAAVYFLQGKLLNARGAYARVPKLEEILSEKDAAAHVLMLRGFVAFFLKSYEQGLKDCQQSLSLRDPNQEPVDTGFTLNAMGLILTQQQRYQEAEGHLQRSLKMLSALDDRVWRALPLNSLGALYREMGKNEQALRYYEESLALIRQFNINLLLHYALYGIGECHDNLGEFTKALDSFQQSLALRQQLTDKEATARTLRRIGWIYRDFGDYAQALSYFQKSLKLDEELNQKDLAAARLRDIGVIYHYQNNPALAFEYFERSIKLAEEANDLETLWATNSAKGWLYSTLHNPSQALQSFQKSLAAGEAFGKKDKIIASLEPIALTYARLGEYEKAELHLQKAMTLCREAQIPSDIAWAHYYASQIQLLRKDYDRAIESSLQGLRAAEGLKNKAPLYLLTLLLQTYLARGDYQKVTEYSERAASRARQLNDPQILSEVRVLSGQAYRALNQPEKARLAFAEAIQNVEAMRTQVAGDELERQRYFENWVYPYHQMIDLLLAQNKFGEALIYAERAKARSLLEVLQNGRLDIAKTMTGQEQAQERRFNQDILTLNAQWLREMRSAKPNQSHIETIKSRLQKARLQYEDFQNRLYVAHPQLKSQRGDAEAFKLEEASLLLPDAKTALLEYVVTPDKAYLLAITRGEGKNLANIKVFSLPVTSKELAAKVGRFRNQLAERDFDFTGTAKELYATLIQPALGEIKDKTRLIIVPDAALWEMPFQALMAEDNHYLIQDAALAYAPSLTFLRELQKPKNPQANLAEATLLAVGNPLMQGQSLTSGRRDDKLLPLPESEREVKNLAQLYGLAGSKILVGAEALEERIKAVANQYAILHFATHGILNDTRPMYSSLVLSQAESGKEDGLLEAWEVMKMDLQARLVVLSACETGRGRVGAGEGLLGFSWALFVAGCPTTVVSQWKVDSASTGELMLEFHKQLQSPATRASASLAAAEALRQASLTLMRSDNYSHPFYWAGFVVVGKGF